MRIKDWPFSHLSIILHLSVGIFWPSFDPFLSLMFLMDGRLGFRATTIDFLQAVGFSHSGGHMASVSYYRYHVLFCKIQVRQQSGWSYLLWQPCDVCIVKALMTWNKNAQKQFHPTVHKPVYKNHHPFMEKKTMSFRKFVIPNTSLIYNLP